MSAFDRKTELYGEERKKIAAEEAAKEFLYDKSIGGPHPVLRPDDKFIESHIGKPRSQDEIEHDTKANTEQRYDAEQAQAHRQKQFEDSVARHNAAIRERSDQQTQSNQAEPEKTQGDTALNDRQNELREYLQRQRDQDHDRSR